MNRKEFIFFIGTTAEFIKIAPVIKELKKRRIPFRVITAGQTSVRFEVLEKFIGKVKSDIKLKEKVNKSSTVQFVWWAARTLITAPFLLNSELKKINKNDSYFIIHGDTVTSSIGAIIAKVYRLKLVHIESGDLSFNLAEPFPEEICRNINIRLADIMFAPTDWAKRNLKGLKGVKVSTKHNSIIETCLWGVKTGKFPDFAKKIKKYYILVLHRQEHVIFRKNWSKRILKLVLTNAKKDLHPVILNHVLTTQLIEDIKPTLPKNIIEKIILMPPIPYRNFVKLIDSSEFMATDGASNQQEVYYMGKPCLALRDRTEQIEGLNQNVILCKSSEKIIKNFLANYKKYKRKPVSITNNQRPSKIIVDYLTTH